MAKKLVLRLRRGNSSRWLRNPRFLAVKALKPSRVRERKGFSLVEILVVLLLMGVLTAAAIVQYRNYAEEAAVTRAKADLNQIVSAGSQYRAEMGVGTIDNLVDDKWCAELTDKTKTGPMGEKVGPWIASCPTPPHSDGKYTVQKADEYTVDATYTYGGGSIVFSTMK